MIKIEWSSTIVGHYYRVPCVRVTEWWGAHGWLPIIGPKHEDAEIIRFDNEHFHLDWRFVSQRLFKRMSGVRGPSYVYSSPISCPDNRGGRVVLEGPTLKRRLCKRDWPALPPLPWRAALEEAFVGKRMKNGICPHRGIPLVNCPVVDDVVTCPTHGLRWNVTTGELVREHNEYAERETEK